MKTVLLACCLLLGPALPARAASPEDSVVKVFAKVRYPSPLKPWTNGPTQDVLGCGTIIEGRRILTNAHVVLYATEVQVQPCRGGSKIDAKVEMIAPEMDLALLSVADVKFFAQHPALPRSKKLPKVQDSVSVYGLPVGGFAVTKGVVSRIGFGAYYPSELGLIIQVSAAINQGNSGGPAVVGNQAIGIVFCRLSEQQNIGYVIPNEEIDLFLADIKTGHHQGKLSDTAGTQFQRCENPTLRRYLKLGDAKGLLIVPPPHRPAHYPFQEFDLLTSIGPYEIDNDGMVQLPGNLQLIFLSVIAKLAKDNAVPVTIVRRGARLKVSWPLSREDNRLVRDYRGEKPAYFIYGPLVFSPVMESAIELYERAQPELSIQSPLFTRSADRLRFPGEELVVVTSPFFAHRIAKGYSNPVGQVVAEVNGTKVKNLKHLVEILRDCKDEYLIFRFAGPRSEVLVFRREEMLKATGEILEDNGISPNHQGSAEILKVWKQARKR